jgi:hypothetical protein
MHRFSSEDFAGEPANRAANWCSKYQASLSGQVAQLVEQRTENPRVGGSIPSLATISSESKQKP